MTPLGANFGVLRTIRLLRPLRTLKRIESMRRLINSLLGALPGLVNVAVMMFAFVFVMSLFGVKMFKGTMRFHCTPEDDYDGLLERQLLYADQECEILVGGNIPAWGGLTWGARCESYGNDEDCGDAEYCTWDAGEETCLENDEKLVAGDAICNIGTDHITGLERTPYCRESCTGTATGADSAGKTCDLDPITDGSAECWEGCVGGEEPTVPTCTGTATDTSKTCDLSAVTDGSAQCWPGCDPDTRLYQSKEECVGQGHVWWTSANVPVDIPIREAWVGSCALAIDKMDCRAAGNCEWNEDTDVCSPTVVTVQYINPEGLDLPKMVEILGVSDRVIAEDLRDYGTGDKYELACYGFLKPDETGYDKDCDSVCADGVAAEGKVCCDKQPRDCPCNCMDGYVCDDTGGPNHGFSTFDNVGLATLSIFQIITLEGWTEVMDCLTDMSNSVLVTSYFVLLVWVGAFFLTHYLLAMICLEFAKKMKGTQMANAELDAAIRYKAKHDDKPVDVQITSTAADGPQLWAYNPTTMLRTDYSFKSWAVTDTGFQITTKEGKLESFECQEADHVCEEMETEDAISYAPWSKCIRAIKKFVKTNPEKKRAKLQKKIDYEKEHGPTMLKKVKLKVSSFVTWGPFESFINTIIIVNFFMLAVDHHGMDQDMATTFENINLVLTLIFAGEMFAKIFAFGLGDYLNDKFNCFDAFIVTTSLIELAMASESGDGGSFSVLRTLRLLRILRSFKLVKGMDTLKKMIATTAGSMAAIANFAVLLMLLLYIFALVGMQMFGGGLEIEGETARPHFDNLIWSFVSVFLVMTRENWQALLYDTMYASGTPSMLYYYALIISTNYILLALFVGTLLENFEKFFLAGGEGDQAADKEKKENKKRLKFLRKMKLGKKQPPKEEDVAEAVNDAAMAWKKKLSKPPSGGGGVGAAAAALGSGGGGSAAGGAMAAFASPSPAKAAGKYVAEQEPRERITSTDKAPEPLQLLPDESTSVFKRCRAKAKEVVNSNLFETFVIIAIIVSSGTLAIEHPLDDKHAPKAKILEVLDVFFTVFFTFEMVSKILALGLVSGQDAYLRSGWNLLDGFIVVTANLVLITGAEGGFFRIIRTVRVLRPLRAIQRSPGMRAVAGGLFKAVPSIATVAMLVFFFMVVSAIFCVQMFKGTMWMCTNPDCGPDTDGQYCSIDECSGSYVDAESGEMAPTEWVNGDWNFDALGPALLALFEIFALEAWPDILLALVDATDQFHGPKENAQLGAVWLFVIMIMLGAFFLLNLFVGVIVTAYNEVQNDDEEDAEAETAARHERMWTKDLVELVAMAQPQKLVYLDFKYRGPFMRITSARWFEPVVMLIIILNVAVMGVDTVDTETGQTPKLLQDVVEYINIFFTYSFAVEMVVKLISFSWAYFKEPWNIFDFVITNVSLVEQLFPLPLNPTVVRIFRIFRLARLLRLSRKAKGIKTLIKTFSATLPSLGHVGFLLMIFFFMYAVLGTQLWWNLTRGELVNDYNNFSSFGASLYALFRLSTGENWNGIMHECMTSAPDCHMGYCSINEGTERVCVAGYMGEFCEEQCTQEAPDCMEAGDGLWDGRWVPPIDHPHRLRLDESCIAMGGVSDRENDDGVPKFGKGWVWEHRDVFDPSTGVHVEGDWVERADVPLTDPFGDYKLGMVYSDCGSSASSTYHITFTIICSLTTLNLIIAVILFAFFDFSESAKKPTLEGDKIARFEDAWATFDKNAEGELPASNLSRLIMANGTPLGTKKFADAEDLEQELWETGLLLDRNGKIQFTELLHAMVFVAFGVDCAKIEAERREARRARKLGGGGDSVGDTMAQTPMLGAEPGSPSFRDSPEDAENGRGRNLERDMVLVAEDGDEEAVGGKIPGGGKQAFGTDRGGVAKEVRLSNIEDQEPMSPLSPSPEKPVLLGEMHPLSPVTPMPTDDAGDEDDSLLPAPMSLPAADVAKAMESAQQEEAPGRPQP
jgi:hypothetical protein